MKKLLIYLLTVTVAIMMHLPEAFAGGLPADAVSERGREVSGKVVEAHDYGTHTLFVAEVTEAQVLSSAPSVTYAYYFDHIKPKPQPVEESQSGWVCKICGYVYEGEELPSDFICPLCKHGASDFEKIK